MLPKIKQEIERLLKVDFIRTARYVQWLSNIILVIKKNSKVRICIDFHNLNLATPKDEYVMPIADMLADVVASNGISSFTDGYSGYNQIYLTKEDEHKTKFRCPKAIGIFEWVVMPFVLKNIEASYQKVMNLIFHDLIEQCMEVCIDDVVVKSANFQSHLANLEQVFLRIRKHSLKTNLDKCAFRILARRFLGFLVH